MVTIFLDKEEQNKIRFTSFIIPKFARAYKMDKDYIRSHGMKSIKYF